MSQGERSDTVARTAQADDDGSEHWRASRSSGGVSGTWFTTAYDFDRAAYDDGVHVGARGESLGERRPARLDGRVRLATNEIPRIDDSRVAVASHAALTLDAARSLLSRGNR